jgi:hypothetical protein
MKSMNLFAPEPTNMDNIPDIPTGEGGGFSRIAPVTMRTLFRVGAKPENYNSIGIEPETNAPPDGLFEYETWGDNWTAFYFEAVEQAQAFCDSLPKMTTNDGSRQFPHRAEMVWYMSYPAAEVLNYENLDQLLERGEFVTDSNTIITSFRSKKIRHIFHLISLPSMVSAVARWAEVGVDIPKYDLSELVSSREYSDEEFGRLCGGAEGNWKTSALSLQRDALWAALGEENGSAYVVAGKGGKYATTSTNLDTILSRAVYSDWPQPIWCRVIQVADPHKNAQYEGEDADGNVQIRHRRVSVVSEIFDDEEEAIAAALKDAEENGGQLSPRLMGAESLASLDTTEYPELPKAYADAGISAVDLLADLKDQNGKPPAIAARALGVSADDVEAWRKFLGE